MPGADGRIGTAGWSIPRAVADAFPAHGTALARYASVFDAVEINTSFYRPHRPDTYRRWADAVPDGFRFAVKVPKAVTHDGRLAAPEAALDRLLAETGALGPKRGPLLVQLPPNLPFDPEVASAFLGALRARTDGPVALEPRHPSWFEADPDALLRNHQVARVAADPVRAPGADEPGGWPGLVYRRLHGSPHIYRSAYAPERTPAIAETLARRTSESWCAFDNTGSGAAAADALALRTALSGTDP